MSLKTVCIVLSVTSGALSIIGAVAGNVRQEELIKQNVREEIQRLLNK